MTNLLDLPNVARLFHGTTEILELYHGTEKVWERPPMVESITIVPANYGSAYWGYDTGFHGASFGSAPDAVAHGATFGTVTVQSSGRLRLRTGGVQIPGLSVLTLDVPGWSGETLTANWDGGQGIYISTGTYTGLYEHFATFVGVNLTIGLGEALDLQDPEVGLILSDSFPVTTLLSTGTNLSGNLPVVFACDFTGLDGSSGGVIFEAGGSGSGAYVGFRADGTFVARGGSGVAPATATVALIEIASGSAPSGDGTLVVEFNGPGSAVGVRAWWNGELLGSDVGTHTGGWTGSDSGGYLRWNDSLSGDGYSSWLTGEYYGSDVAYTTASDLRHYENQTSNWVAP